VCGAHSLLAVVGGFFDDIPSLADESVSIVSASRERSVLQIGGVKIGEVF
jgi:hypothetical protein